MTEDNSKVEVPKNKNLKDIFLSISNDAINVLPDGYSFKELFEDEFNTSLQNRKEKWFDYIGKALEDVIKQHNTFKKISFNENFIDIFIHATHIALTTINQDKIEALKNAVLNTLFNSNLAEFKQKIFMSLLEQFNEYHIIFLKLLDNQTEDIRNITFKIDHSFSIANPNFQDLIERIMPECIENMDFPNLIITDLFSKKLTLTNDSNFGLSFTYQYGQAIISTGKRTTELGREFLTFISKPFLGEIPKKMTGMF